MLRRLSLGLLASAISVASLPAIAQEGSADDLGVMSISLKDVVKPNLKIKCICYFNRCLIAPKSLRYLALINA